MAYMIFSLFLAAPIAAIVFLVLSICRYASAKKQERQQPGSVSPEELKRRKVLLILASILSGVFLVIVLGFMALMFLAVAFM